MSGDGFTLSKLTQEDDWDHQWNQQGASAGMPFLSAAGKPCGMKVVFPGGQNLKPTDIHLVLDRISEDGPNAINQDVLPFDNRAITRIPSTEEDAAGNRVRFHFTCLKFRALASPPRTQELNFDIYLKGVKVSKQSLSLNIGVAKNDIKKPSGVHGKARR